jgi:hypothetical protein
MDDNGNKLLDKYEFSKALSEIGLLVNKMEFNELMKFFDKNGINIVCCLIVEFSLKVMATFPSMSFCS